MNFLSKAALWGSFFVFNFISTSYPIDKVNFPQSERSLPCLETNLSERDKVLVGVKKADVAKEQNEVRAEKKIYSSRDVGIATYYADAFHGRRTASGEIFDMNGMTTAAAWEYSFGTILRVTNTANGNNVEVKVNDRGAFPAYGVTLDLSKAAFAKLAPLSQGVVWVKIEMIK